MVDFSPIAEAIAEHWGERCDDFNPDCRTCMAWKAYDRIAALSAENERLRRALEQIEQQLDYGQINMALHIARRALEGGE